MIYLAPHQWKSTVCMLPTVSQAETLVRSRSHLCSDLRERCEVVVAAHASTEDGDVQRPDVLRCGCDCSLNALLRPASAPIKPLSKLSILLMTASCGELVSRLSVPDSCLRLVSFLGIMFSFGFVACAVCGGSARSSCKGDAIAVPVVLHHTGHVLLGSAASEPN